MKVLAMGPNHKVTTGQSLAFKELTSKLRTKSKCKVSIIYNVVFYSKWLDALYLLVMWPYFIFSFFLLSPNIVYLSLSRSRLGFYRESIVYFFAKVFKVPIVVHLHGLDFYNFTLGLSKLERSVFNWLFSSVSDAIVLSTSMKSEFREFPKINVEAIPNFIAEELQGLTSENNFEESTGPELETTVNILYMSNIMESKGIIDLLDSVCLLSTSAQEKLSLVIAGRVMGDSLCGESKIRRVFEQKIRHVKTKTSAKISYLGAISGSRKADCLKACNIFVLPTKYRSEAQPISIIEAMCFGSAVISTKHNLIPDLVIEKENGLLVAPGDIEELAAAIEYLVNNPVELEKFGMFNSAKSAPKFTLARHSQAIFNLLERRLILK